MRAISRVLLVLVVLIAMAVAIVLVGWAEGRGPRTEPSPAAEEDSP